MPYSGRPGMWSYEKLHVLMLVKQQANLSMSGLGLTNLFAAGLTCPQDLGEGSDKGRGMDRDTD